MQRRMGRRDREAAQLALRAPPLAALAEDEVRGVAGTRRRRIYRSAGQPRRPGRVAGRILRWRRFRLRRKVGTGFDTKLLLELRARLDALEIPKPPFTKAIGLPRIRAHWVRPEIVVQVAFIEWTVHGKLRHPRLLGIRTDKSAREVVRETS